MITCSKGSTIHAAFLAASDCLQQLIRQLTLAGAARFGYVVGPVQTSAHVHLAPALMLIHSHIVASSRRMHMYARSIGVIITASTPKGGGEHEGTPSNFQVFTDRSESRGRKCHPATGAFSGILKKMFAEKFRSSSVPRRKRRRHNKMLHTNSNSNHAHCRQCFAS